MYDRIFFTNVLRLLNEKNMTKDDLHKKSGVSASIISDITRGQGNPTLATMVAIATALDTPLPIMLEHVDAEVAPAFDKQNEVLPKGFQRVSVILPEQKAFIVNKWAKDVLTLLKKRKAN